MKKILFILFALTPLLCFSQVSQLGYYSVDSIIMNSGTLNKYGTTLAASANAPDSISGTAQVKLTGTAEVVLQPGFKADAFRDTGYFIAQIGTGAITNVEVMGSSTDGNQYERYEVGLNLAHNPLSPPDYITEINNFISSPINPNFSISSPPYGPNILDPYDPDQVKIKAVFTNQSSGHQYVRYGFYQQAVTSFTSTSYTIATDTSYPFRVRFAPPETGAWNVQTYLYINDTLAPGNQPYLGSFNVNSTTNPGNVGIDPINTQFFAFQNNSNTLYFPVGQSIFWCEVTNPHLYAMGAPQELSSRLGGGDANHLSYMWLRWYMKDLAAHGGNYSAIGTVPWSFGVEWGSQLQNITPIQNDASVMCNYRQDASYELDSTLFACENEGIYLQVSFEKDGFFYKDNPYEWYNAAHPLYSCPYYFLLGGSQTDSKTKIDLIHFFDSTLAWKYYKKRLFYMEARWGYSPNIAVWNLANEADQFGLIDSMGTEYTGFLADTMLGFTPASPNAFQSAMSVWVDTMSTYLHSFYPSHLTSISYARASAPNGYYSGNPQYTSGSDVSPNYVDVLDGHEYNSDFNEDTLAERAYRAENSFGTTGLSKPFLFGELGNNFQCNTSDPFSDYIEDISFHNAEWATAFMSSGTGLYFYDFPEGEIVHGSYVADPIRHRKNYTALWSFFKNHVILSALENPGWGASCVSSVINNVIYFSRFNTSYNSEIGWMQNATVSWRNLNLWSCLSPISSSGFSTTLQFNGLTWGDIYDLTIYNAYTGDSITTVSGIASMGTMTVSNWPFAFAPDTTQPISDTTRQPDYAYLLARYDFHKPVKRGDTVVMVLPNDTVYLPMDSVHFIGSIDAQHKNYLFHWNFGNGMSSNAKPFPNFIYHNIGNYLTSVNYSDSAGNDKTIIYQTYVVLDSALKKQFVKSNPSPETNIFLLAPNPTSESFEVYINNGQDIDNIEIYDMFGRECFNEYSPKNNVFNVSALAAGVYFVKIISNGLATTQKLVIAR